MSTHREIEEVYLSDIIKIQKMTKSIVAESLGEINKMGGEMKYCCEDFKQGHKGSRGYPWYQFRFNKKEKAWYIQARDYEMCEWYDLMDMIYCPFCGEELKSDK